MTELDHDDLRYVGLEGEVVTVTVKPQDTTQLVTYTLEGTSHALKKGESIRFNLKKNPGDQPMILQMNFDFNAEGSYRVGITTVENEENNECVQIIDGPPLSINIFRFFVD